MGRSTVDLQQLCHAGQWDDHAIKLVLVGGKITVHYATDKERAEDLDALVKAWREQYP